MYLLYKTPAIILNYRDIGESERIFSVFSKEFGLLDILAKGIRNCASKLRPNMSVFSFVSLGFVSRKSSWLLTDAAEINNFLNIKNNNLKLKLVAGWSAFLARFLRGPQKDLSLWKTIIESFEFLNSAELKESEIQNLDYYFKLKGLSILGYIDKKEISEINKPLDQNSLFIIREHMASYSQILEKAVKESQL